MTCSRCHGDGFDRVGTGSTRLVDHMTPCPICNGSGTIESERETIIAQLAFTEGVNESVYDKYTDQDLQDRLEFLFGGDNNDKKD